MMTRGEDTRDNSLMILNSQFSISQFLYIYTIPVLFFFYHFWEWGQNFGPNLSQKKKITEYIEHIQTIYLLIHLKSCGKYSSECNCLCKRGTQGCPP